ncbi:hypothetical protein AUG19_08190 [archaeon 13_1_20CM_2_54_9]|nr:MAG: hypothetical protein AUG19_08190 [archaeon 13_1_20CM_2_54_9]
MMNAEFPAFVLEDVLKTLPQSRAKGLVNKQHLCNKCNTVLNIESLENGEFQIPMSLKSMQPFRIGISGPVAKCSACMTLQMVKTRELENADIPNAMVSAFDRIGLKR